MVVAIEVVVEVPVALVVPLLEHAAAPRKQAAAAAAAVAVRAGERQNRLLDDSLMDASGARLVRSDGPGAVMARSHAALGPAKAGRPNLAAIDQIVNIIVAELATTIVDRPLVGGSPVLDYPTRRPAREPS